MPLAAALVADSITTILSLMIVGNLIGLPRDILISALPKSATAGVAMTISSSLGGNPSLTAAFVILTGIFGAVVVTQMMNVMGIRDYAARGFAIGLTSHGIMIAMAPNAVATAIIMPIAARFLL